MAETPSNEELLSGFKIPRRKKRIRARHALAIGAGSIQSSINVTPLVDVVLVLLIIFMVVTPMITRGRPMEMVETKFHDQKSDSGEQIVVSVTCENPKMGPERWACGGFQVYVGTEHADETNIGDKIQQEMRKGTGAREIHLKADRRLNYGPVRETMQRINAAGVANIALGSEEVKDPKEGK